MNRKLVFAVNLSAVAVIAAVTLWLCFLPKAQASQAGAGPQSSQNSDLGDTFEPASAPASETTDTTTGTAGTTGTAPFSGSAAGKPADPGWLASTARKTGIPSRALQAYVQASNTLKREQPGCRLAWNTLAALGLIESEHARGQLRANGDVSPKIIGPVLNGNGFAAIPDSDGGVFDGDSRWDRAVGPMQFIPQTWARYGRDGNDDGVADPQNIDDAALSAAGYLCAAAAEAGNDGLRSAAGWSHAVLAYNQSSVYLNDIFDAAQRYAGLSQQAAR